MELTLEAVAKDAFRRDFFLRCFTEREAQALELRFAFLHRVRQYKRLVGRRDLLPRAAKDIVASYVQQVESTNQLLLPPSAEPLRTRVLAAAAAGHCPLDLFNGMETLVRDHMTRDAFPQFLRSSEYAELCAALRSRREVPLAEVLVDPRRTQFLTRFLAEQFPEEEGNLRFWAHVQTRFLPLIQTTLFSVALFEEVQRHVRHVFNRFLVEGGEGAVATAATRVPEAVRRATLQQIMKLQSEPFSPPRYASLFRAAQDCVWEWLQTDVYPKFRASSLYVMLVVETEDLETDQQLRRLSEHVQATVKTSATVRPEKRQSETIPKLSSRKSEAQLKANAVLVPIKQPSRHNLWGQGAECNRRSFDRVLTVQELAHRGIHSISVASGMPPENSADEGNKVVFELFCTGDQQEAAAEAHPTHLSYWRKNTVIPASGNLLSPSRRTLQPAAPKPSFHDFVLPKGEAEGRDSSETVAARYLFGVCLTLWRQKTQETANTSATNDLAATLKDPLTAAQPCSQFMTVLTTEPMHKNSRRLLLQLASCSMNDLTVDNVSQVVSSIFASSSNAPQLLSARYAGFCLQPNLRMVDMSLSSVFKEISSQTFISILASVLVGKSIILVSERSTALISVAEAAREFLRPFEWMHFYLPFCPVATSSELCEAGLFSKVNTSPFLVGCEGTLSYQKKDSGTDQRFRIRNSIYTTHKVSLHLQAPITAGPNEYPLELLQTTAIVIDIDSDDIYVPEKVEIPELPQSILRSLESMLSTALHSSRITQGDSHLFGPSKLSSFIDEMLEPLKKPGQPDEPSAEVAPDQLELVNPSLDDRARLALLWFLEALFGDVVYYFCSLQQNFAVETQSTSTHADEFLLFEVDSFLDAHTELGCRDFFRQCFHTELFRKFMLAQHMHFAFTSASAPLEPSETTLELLELQREVLPDAFI
ncbi:hypothetical protein PHYPSEUDO_015602 [Phytophthora pseudosyringae]|uniref:RGS domain-containing protein n=1 Tax=Phytophthora pseudosyringae TaxID=221518 RepID=A0A8T1VYE2_9STRA|nr:hypothetical protein PHYPSEUDO_015602 [Phytophthora pseudosyringae]